MIKSSTKVKMALGAAVLSTLCGALVSYRTNIVKACDDVGANGYIEYQATVDNLYVVNFKDSDPIIYIKDADEHLLKFAFDEQLLLLDEGDKILVYIDNAQKDESVFDITKYQEFGFQAN